MLNLSDVKSLLKHTDEPTLSLYLNVDPSLAENQANTPTWRINAKNSLNNLEKSLTDEQKVMLGELRVRVENYLEHYSPAGKGLALFYSPSLEQIYELPLALEPQAAFGKLLIAPLLALIAGHKANLIVMVDHAQARFYIAVGGQIQLQETMDLQLDTSAWRTKTAMPSNVGIGRGNATDEYDDRVTQELTRQHQKVAVRAGQIMQQQRARWMLLGGDDHSAHTVRNLLPSYLKAAVVGVLPLHMRYIPAELLKHVQPVLEEHDKQSDLKRVEQVIDLAKSRGRAALGTVAVRHALERGQIEELIVPDTAVHDTPTQELVFEVTNAGGAVSFVRGPAAEHLLAEGGVAAQLYYAA